MKNQKRFEAKHLPKRRLFVPCAKFTVDKFNDYFYREVVSNFKGLPEIEIEAYGKLYFSFLLRHGCIYRLQVEMSNGQYLYQYLDRKEIPSQDFMQK